MMRGRLRRLLSALRISLLVLTGMGLMIFIFDDGHKNLPVFEASAQATESPIPLTPLKRIEPVFDPNTLALPAGFQPQWEPVGLDQGKIRILKLDTPFSLKQTRNQLGSEYYDYAAFLFEQLAAELPDAELSEKLKTLSTQAQMLGHAVDRVGDLQYDGPALENMAHLQVRAAMQAQLDVLNYNALRVQRLDQQGQLIEAAQAQPVKPGESLLVFRETLDTLLNHPEAKHYPQAFELIARQARLLDDLSTHVSLEWKTVEACKQSCNKTIHVTAYAQQTLPENVIAATMR